MLSRASILTAADIKRKKWQEERIKWFTDIKIHLSTTAARTAWPSDLENSFSILIVYIHSEVEYVEPESRQIIGCRVKMNIDVT